MDTNIAINWNELLVVLLSSLAPTIVGFLQQLSKSWAEKAPWWAKSIITAGIGALITMITNYVSGAAVPVAAGAVLASVGSVNIALRKGSRANLEAIREARVEEAVKKFTEGTPA